MKKEFQAIVIIILCVMTPVLWHGSKAYFRIKENNRQEESAEEKKIRGKKIQQVDKLYNAMNSTKGKIAIGIMFSYILISITLKGIKTGDTGLYFYLVIGIIVGLFLLCKNPIVIEKLISFIE